MEAWETARGWLTSEERALLYGLARGVPSGGVVLNVGVEYGASVVCLMSGMRPDTTIYAIDIDTSKYEGPPIVNLIEADSGAIAATWDRPIHLAFIDGDHSFAGVMRDVQFCDHLVPGAMVIFHDCYDFERGHPNPHAVCPEVDQAVDAWVQAEPAGRWSELLPIGSSRIFRRLA